MPVSPLTPEQIPADLVNQIPPGAKVVKLSPEEEMQFANPGAKIVGPRDLSEDDLFSLADTQQFNPRTFAAANPEVLQDSELVKKLARVNARLQDRGFKFKDIAATPEDPEPSALSGAWNVVKKAGEGAAHFAKGVALNAANLLTIFPAAGAAITPGGVTPQQAGEVLQKTFAEAGAALESGATGILEGAQTAAKKAGQLLGGTPYLDRPENEQISDFLNSVDREKLREDRISAHGPFMTAIGGEVISGLEEKGAGPEPERVAEMAGSDPLSLLMFGKIFSGVHKVGKLAEPIVAPIQKAAADALKQSLGEDLLAAGSAGRAVSKTVEVTAKPLPTLGAIAGGAKGAAIGGPGGAVVGAGAGAAGGRALAKGLRGVSKAAKGVAGIGTEVGEQVLSPLSSAAQGYRAVIDAFPKFLTATVAGAGLDIGLIAASTELPDEAGAMPLLGAAFGAGKGVLSGARQFAISTKFSPDFWQNPGEWAKPYTPDNSFSQLAGLHKMTAESASEIQTARVNAVNSFLRQQKSDAPIYFVNDEAGLSKALEQIYSRQGVLNAAERAKFSSSQNGIFTENIVDDAGKFRRVIIAKNPDSAPHEGFHGVQAVLGESANQAVDLMVYKAYADRWELEGREHTSRLLRQPIPNGADWREPLRQATGVESPDVYLARELAAENFDYLFRSGLDRPKGLPGKLANIILNLTDLFGTSPLAGERSPVLGIEPKLELVESIRRQVSPTEVKSTPPKVETVVPTKTPATGAPQKAKQWVDENPTGRPERDTAIRALADAMDSEQGVTVLYWGAKGEPAGDITSVRPERRAQIEAQRHVSNVDRQLMNKLFFPYRVDTTSEGPQFVGWSPDNFNANLSKLEAWVGKVNAARKNFKIKSPYEFDASTSRLTDSGRAALEADIQTFVANQKAGFTGSGKPIVLPESIKARGFTEPEKTGASAVPLAQSRADLINYLFNTQIPETISRLAPLHLAGQEISAATEAGRLVKPVRKRGEYDAKKLAKAGIPGPREVLEVNPFRQWVEQTSKEAKIERPSLIEVSQRLNVPRIEESAPAPGAAPFGGNILTLAAGFQPVAAKAKRLIDMSPEEWKTTVSQYNGKLGGGLTGWAFDLGASAKDAADVTALREAATQLQEASREAMRASMQSAEPEAMMSRAMELVGRSQAAREAFEAATGSNLEGTSQGSSVPFIRKHIDVNYEPPVPGELKIAAQPAKQRNSLSFPKASSGGFKKAWVLPSGEPVQLGGMWHHEWLADNPEVAKRYKLNVPKFKGTDAESIRESALRAGFARINYEVNNGQLTVEARAKDWRKVKNTIEDMVSENLDDIDRVSVTLFDDAVKEIVDSDSSALFNMDTDQEKLAALPFITKGEIRGGAQ